MFDLGYVGQVVKIIFSTGHTTIDFTGTNLKGNGGADWSPDKNDWMEGMFDGTDWYFACHDCSA
jgi:hypothetical protein